jgi:hypothetical protein
MARYVLGLMDKAVAAKFAAKIASLNEKGDVT